MVGTVIASKYRLTRVLGKGGMGSVYEATHVTTGRRVALKVMQYSKTNDESNEARVARFQREALAAGRLETQHVVQVYDAGVDEATGDPYLAMELLDGEDLSHLIRRLGPLAAPLAIAIVTQVAYGLQKAHDAGVIHRDIKPSNIFLAKNEHGERTVKVLDFGIAKVSRTEDETLNDAVGTITATGALVGSPHYMSPEQAKGLKTVDARSDLWSLVVVLYKCLSGRTPFDGHTTLGQVIVAVCSEDATSLQEVAPWIPGDLAAVVRQGLRRDPKMRFPSATALAEALAPWRTEGIRITEAMLRPLSEMELGEVAPRTSDIPTQATPSSMRRAPEIPVEMQHEPALSSSPWPIVQQRGDATVASGPPSMSVAKSFVTPRSEEIAPKPRRIWPAFLAGALTLAGIGVALGWSSIRARISPPPAPAPVVAVVASEASPPAISAPVAPTTKVLRSERVTVGPPGVAVEVDGKAATIESGAVRIDGEPGTIHKVRVTLAGRETVSDVVLTEAGPKPSQVILPAQATAAKTTTAITKPTTTPTTTAKPTPTTKSTGAFDRNFE